MVNKWNLGGGAIGEVTKIGPNTGSIFGPIKIILCVVVMQRIILRQRRRYRIIITTAEGTGNDAGFLGQMANAPGGIAVANCRICQIHSMISRCPGFLGLAEIDDETPTCVATVALMMWKTHSKDRLDAHETHPWGRDAKNPGCDF